MAQIAERSSNPPQIECWSTSADETWAQFQEASGRQVEPLGLAAVDRSARCRRRASRKPLRLSAFPCP